MARRSNPTQDDATPTLFPGWEPPPRRWTPRPGNFAHSDPGRLAALVRGELIERLDTLLLQAVPVWEARFGTSREQSISLIQCVQLALFPDEFSDDERAAEEIAQTIGDRRALVPIDGPIERVGTDAMAAYAESLGVEYDTPDDEPEPPQPQCVIGGVSLPASELAVLRERAGRRTGPGRE